MKLQTKELQVVHEFEAGFSPSSIMLIGDQCTEGFFYAQLIRVLDELDEECNERDFGRIYRPDGELKHGYWNAEWWDENGDEVYGSFKDAQALVDENPGEMYMMRQCKKDDIGACPVNWIELKQHQRGIDLDYIELGSNIRKLQTVAGAALNHLKAVDLCREGTGSVEAVQFTDAKMRKALQDNGYPAKDAKPWQ